ncbi:type II secretion system F family protein [Nonomuraea typhae]|uniref:Type II secretion system F family protein n=1 Tax=Nonomuraea typhae TaxID=2603600 RepID=A0ABW7Z2L3_9ACTN
MNVIVAAMLAGLAAWVWTGPSAAAVRLARLTARRPAARWTLTRQRPAHRAEAWRQATIELCHALAAELAAGRTPGEAMIRAIATVDLPENLRAVAAAARDGGDVAATLAAAAAVPGGEGLARLAACWRVGVGVGGGMAALAERVAATLRAARAHRQEVAAQLAGPRATARLLAVLPLLGLVMASALGMRPLDFLFGGLVGMGCLVGGVSLVACGMWWTGRMASAAQDS